MSSRIKGIIDAVSDLAADYSSRMANANDQGFDTGRVLYHHTEADNIEEFIPSSKGKLGAGVYTSPNPQYGERYVDQSSGSANVLPLFARGPLAKAADIDAASTASRNALLENGQPFSVQEWKSSTNEILKGKGFAGKEVGEEVSIFDPSNIRSVNAAFDPAKKGSSNLLASATGIGLLGALGSEDADAGLLTAGADLAMDYSSRMARAKDQGFDTSTPVYHGTASDFDAFDPDRAIGSQFWSTTDKAAIEAGDVGAQGNGVVKEMYQRINNPAGWNEYDKFGIDELIGQGYDGLKLPEPGGHSTMVAFDPSQYRSVDAAFDPAKKGSSNLLASAAGVGLLGALGSEDADASPSKGLFDSMGDTALESMSGVNRAVADGVNFLTSDQINAILNLSGSDKRIPDLYDIPGIEGGTQGNYMEPGLLRQIVRQGSEFLSPI